MKERFEQFIVQSKQFLLESEYHEQADKISLVCQIVPFEQFYNDQFAILMSSGISTKPDANNKALIIPMLQDVVATITIDEFKQFMTDYFQNNGSDMHTELIVPNAYYGFLFNTNGNVKTLQEAFELLDICEQEVDWDWAMSGGIGFRIVQDVVK